MLMSPLVLAQIDYVNSFLDNCSYRTFKPYPKVQTFMARITLEIPRRCSTHLGFKTLHLLPEQF